MSRPASFRTLAARAMAALLCALSATAAGQELRLVLGTATPGGGFTVYGEALADAVARVDASLRIQPQQTAGSGQNIPLLRAGKLDLGLVEGTAAHEALQANPAMRLSVLAAMYPTPVAFAVRADSPYRTLADLKGRRIVFGAAGSGFVTAARYVLDGLGLELERDFQAVLLKSAEQGPPMVIDGTAAAMWGGGVGWPAFRAIADSPSGARLIAPSQQEIARIRARHPFLKPLTLPAHAYRGQDRDLATVGTWSLVLARSDLPEEAAYRIARALHRAQPAFGERLSQARATSPENTLAAVPAGQLHPGVALYFRDIGLMP